jgi:YHS domain-containing protein
VPPEMVEDPVCGMRIDPDDAAARAEHEGMPYSFCSETCHEASVRRTPCARQTALSRASPPHWMSTDATGPSPALAPELRPASQPARTRTH